MNDFNACNLTWWGVLGFQDSMKQQEIRRNKGKKTKKLRKKRPKIQQKQPRFCGGFSGPFFTIKLGIFKDFCQFVAHQSRLQPFQCMEATAQFTQKFTMGTPFPQNFRFFAEGRKGIILIRVTPPLTCYRLLSGLRPEIGQKWSKNGLEPRRGNGRFFPFSAIFSPSSLVRRKSIFRPFFPISGRRPEGSLQQVNGILRSGFVFIGEKRRGRREGDGKKHVTTICTPPTCRAPPGSLSEWVTGLTCI